MAIPAHGFAAGKGLVLTLVRNTNTDTYLSGYSARNWDRYIAPVDATYEMTVYYDELSVR